MAKMEVIVASCNPVKLDALKRGFAAIFRGEEFDWRSINAPSGVSRQPSSDQETRQGAFNRTQYIKSSVPQADYWCGIEGGIEFDDGGAMYAFAWVVIEGREHTGRARSGTFQLPPEVAHLVKSGLELGEADDLVFKQANSKQKNGAVGLLTDDVLTRTSLYEEAVILALIPFKNRELYSQKT